MLIDLADELGEQLDQMCATDDHVHALRCLAFAHFEGKHFITGNRSVLDKLGRHARLDEQVRLLFRGAVKRIHDGHRLRSEVRAFVRVKATRPAVPRLLIEGDRKIFTVSLDELADSGRVQATVVLGEHLEDAKLYRAATAAFLQRQPWHGLVVTLSAKMGGGSTTANVFEAQAVDAPVVCVVDSDKKGPDTGVGGTALAVQHARQRVHRREDFYVADAHVLEQCRELENLLPAKLVLDALASVPDLLRPAQRAERSGQLGQADHGDLKKLLAVHAGRDGELEFLGHVSQFVETLSPSKLAEYLFQVPVAAAWSALTEQLFAWGCAPKRTHVR